SLALATTFGATIGATVALASKPEVIQLLFALVLLYTAYQLIAPRRAAEVVRDAELPAVSTARKLAMGLIGLFAGASSGLLGIGGGIVIVPALHLVLHRPFKTATATSNLLVGVTALTGAFAYWWQGRLLPVPTLPITAGAFVGALIGSILDRRISSQALRWGMAALLVYSALQMASALLLPWLGGL
ncbi:MAG: sulfite exporter TauE/SafE family protein, partial [Anaerolineae bacterium]|nr:sulfite exporter TauE/SafE family protein [Anaerolineae bacterium]